MRTVFTGSSGKSDVIDHNQSISLSTRGVPAILFSAVEDAKAVTVFLCARMDYG